MAKPTVQLDYAPSPTRRAVKAGMVLMYAAFLTALLHLMISHGGDEAPLRKPSNTYTPFADIETQLKLADADPRDAEIHFNTAGQSAIPQHIALMFTRVYYTAQYLRYPHRVLVGMGDQIINNERQLLAADKLPPMDWMKQHRIGSIYTVYDQGLIGPRLTVTPAP